MKKTRNILKQILCSSIMILAMGFTAGATQPGTVRDGTTADNEYLIDTVDSSQYYESSDRFGNSSTGGVSINGYHRWIQYAGEYAEFKKGDVEIGSYEVFYYLPLQHAGNIKAPMFRIESADGAVTEKQVDITPYNSGDWISLGIYPFAAGEPMSVRIIHPGVDASSPDRKTIRANAVKLRRTGDFTLPPSAINLTMTGSLAVDAEITGRYTFEDQNGAAESGSLYTYYRSDSPDGTAMTVLASGEARGETDIRYRTVTEDIGSYLILEIVPKSEGDKTGEAVRAVLGPIADGWYPPVADQVQITGKPWVDYTLGGSYRYTDRNGEAEAGSTYAWQQADRADSADWITVSEGTADGIVPDIKITKEQEGTYLRLRIIPENKASQNPQGEPAYSAVHGPVLQNTVIPEVRNPRLSGQIVNAEGMEGAAIGGEIKADYTYYHELGYEETEVRYQWYAGDTADGEYTKLSDSRTLQVTEDMAGKYIKAGIQVGDEKQQFSQQTDTAPMKVTWRLSFYDEFDYEAADGNADVFKEKWISDKSQRVLGSPEVKSARIPENIEVRDGFLSIHNRKEHNDNYDFDHTWTTGNIKTVRNDFKYGYYEASYKLAPATGLNQSFWMMSDKVMEAGKFIEMDFNEGHYPYEVATNLHYTENGTTRKVNSLKYYPYGKGETTLASGFNKLAGVLEPNKNGYAWEAPENSNTYRVYINDKLTRSTKSLPYDPASGRIYLSVAIYPGFAGSLIDEEADNTAMVVDYVRFYEPLE